MTGSKLSKRGKIGYLIISVLIGLAVYVLQPFFEIWEYPILDWHLNMTAASANEQKIVLVLGRDRSMIELENWPWPRDIHAQLIAERLSGARVVAYDVFLVDKTAPEQDAALAQAMRAHGNVVIGNSYRADGALLQPLEAFRESASVGYFSFTPDSDYVMRRYALARKTETPEYTVYTPSFVYAVLDAAGYAPVIDEDNRLRLLGAEQPLQLDEALRVFKLPAAGGAYPIYEFSDVLHGRLPAGTFDDAIVFVGISATGASDNVHTSAGYLSGTRVLADITHSILSGYMPCKPPIAAQLLFFAAAIACCLLCAALLPNRLNWLPMLATAVAVPLFAHLMFRTAAVYLPSAALCAATVLCGVLHLFYLRVLRESRQRQAMLMNMIACMVSAIDAKDPVTAGHSRRVSEVSARIATLKGLRHRDIENIRFAALIHDIGKIGVPDAVLNKPGRFTEEEFAEMKCHPEKGVVIMEQAELPELIISGIRDHHERPDGKGYPAGKTAERLSLYAEIIKIADVYDALSSKRQYKEPWPIDKVCDVLYEGRGAEFNAELLDLFLKEIQPALWRPKPKPE